MTNIDKRTNIINPFDIEDNEIRVKTTINRFTTRIVSLRRIHDNIFIGTIGYTLSPTKGYIVVFRFNNEIVWITNRLRRMRCQSRISCWNNNGDILDGTVVYGNVTDNMMDIVKIMWEYRDNGYSKPKELNQYFIFKLISLSNNGSIDK